MINKYISILRNDKNMTEIARGMIIAFIIKATGAGLSFGFNVAVARLLGTEGTGLYFMALAVTTIGSVIGRVGLDNTLLRFIATKATYNDWAGVRGVFTLSIRFSTAASLAVTLSVFFSAPWLADKFFNNSNLAEPLRWMSLSILPTSLLNLQSESLKGVKRIRDAMLLQSVGVPLTTVLLLAPFANSRGVIGVTFAYVLGTLIIAIIGGMVWKKTIAEHSTSVTPFSLQELWSSCRPLFVVSLMNDAIRSWGPIFLLGIWSTTENVGIFGAAMRVVTLTTFMLFTLNNILAPKLAELYAKGEIETLASTARRSAGILALLASPIFIVLIFRADWIMSIYGKEFSNGALVLAILTTGQIANVFTGSLGIILIITGNERYTQNITVLSTIFLILISALLIPNLGAIGAALAITISGTGLSVASAIFVQRNVGIRAIPLFNRFFS
jgi:O-antigen/teichoic acid export membrane protein